jgi:multidrug resistance efflux pump
VKTWKLLLTGAAVLGAVAAPLGFYHPFGARPRVLDLPGTVEIQEVRLSPKIGGRVGRVAVSEGDLVKPGQPLVCLEAPELQAQREQLQARWQAAAADLEKAQNGARPEEKAAAEAAAEAARARLRRLEAGSRREEIEQARGELQTAEAVLQKAQKDLDRAGRLTSTSMSRADYDGWVAAHEQARGRAAAARARLEELRNGPRAEDVAEARAELARAEANAALLRAGTRSEDLAAAAARVEELRARLREVEANLREAVVTAPEAAVVEVLAVRPGDVVAANQPVARVLRADDLWVKAYVPETLLGRVRLNQAVEVTVDSHPGRRFAGTVRWIASESEFTPRNVQSADERHHQVFALKVRVADPDGVFKSGMAAEVHVSVQD